MPTNPSSLEPKLLLVIDDWRLKSFGSSKLDRGDKLFFSEFARDTPDEEIELGEMLQGISKNCNFALRLEHLIKDC